MTTLLPQKLADALDRCRSHRARSRPLKRYVIEGGSHQGFALDPGASEHDRMFHPRGPGQEIELAHLKRGAVGRPGPVAMEVCDVLVAKDRAGDGAAFNAGLIDQDAVSAAAEDYRPAGRFPGGKNFFRRAHLLIVAALGMVSLAAQSACYTHPDNGLVYCTQAWECPIPGAWDQRSQLCTSPAVPAPVCTGTASGTYVPAAAALQNVANVSAPRAIWARVGSVVTVAGVFGVNAIEDGMVQFYLPLPVPTAFKDNGELAGSMTGQVRPVVGSIRGPREVDQAVVLLEDIRTSGETVRYVYSYHLSECGP